MSFKLKIKNDKLEITSDLTPDNYKKYLDIFISEFTPIIKDIKKLSGIIESLLESKSWRLLNREVRKACNIYVVQNKLMSCAEFQNKWFYESVMYMRAGIGAKAEWLDNTTPTVSKAIPKGKTITVDLTDSTIREEDKGTKTIYPYVKNGWMHYKDGAYRVGKPTPEELIAEHKSRSGK